MMRVPFFNIEEEEEFPVAIAAPCCSYDGRYHIDDDEHDFMDASPNGMKSLLCNATLMNQ